MSKDMTSKWHPTQKIEKSADGGIVLTAEIPHLPEVARWVLSGAPHIHVLEYAEGALQL